MINVTDTAKELLKSILESKVDNYYACLRLSSLEEGQFELGIDIEQPGDDALEYEGSKLLVVERELADGLNDKILDIVQTPEGPELVIDCC